MIITKLNRALQSLKARHADALKDIGATPRQILVLEGIEQFATGHPSQTDLVNNTGMDRSTLADVVRRLVGRKLISRSRSKQDARTYQLQLTESGRSLLKQAKGAMKRVERSVSDDLVKELDKFNDAENEAQMKQAA